MRSTWSPTTRLHTGYSLLWNRDDSSSAKVGELVAIIEQDALNGSEWQPGVVRCMKCTTARGLKLGMQMLSPSTLAMWAYMDDSEIRAGRKMPGILLPEIKVLGQQTSLLLPTLPFRAGGTATLLTTGTIQNIKLTRQLENTGSFVQHHLSTAITD